LGPNHAPDRREALADAWRTLLMHEFHDILPGSSIPTVYWDAREALTELARRLESLTRDALARIFGSSSQEGGDRTVVINPSPFKRHELLAIPAPDDDRAPVIDGQR